MLLNVNITNGDLESFCRVKEEQGYIYKTKAEKIKELRNHLEISVDTELTALSVDADKIVEDL